MAWNLRELKNIGKISKLVGDTVVHNLPYRKDFPALAVKNNAKADIKVFWSYLIVPDLFTFNQFFCHGFWSKNDIENTQWVVTVKIALSKRRNV